MIKQTGDTYTSSKFAKGLWVSEAKVGKTCFEIAAALGVLPWQKLGGIVDDPRNLHVMTFDSNAAGGVKRFLMETCGAPAEAMKFNIYNLQDDMRKVSESSSDYDMTFYDAVNNVIDSVAQSARGTPMMIISSLTGLAAGFERAIIGPPTGKGYSDPSKWKALAHQLAEIQNRAQVDRWHCIWEAHIDKPPPPPMGATENAPKESIRVSGSAGRNWGYNVEQVFRIRRQHGMKYKDTKADLVYLDSAASLEFIAGGRNFTEALEPKEYDPMKAFQKLGLQVGGWGEKSTPKPLAPKQAVRLASAIRKG